MGSDRDANFSSHSVAVRIQKKLLGKLASRNTAKHFISETTSRLLDNIYRILKEFYSKKEAEKVIKYVIKTVIKIGVLLKGEHFSMEQQRQLDEFVKKFRQLILTVTSFVQVDFSYDRLFLKKQMDESQAIVLDIIRPHLTEKSAQRVNKVFSNFGREDFLDAVFRPQSIYGDLRRQIGTDLSSLIETGEL